VGFAEFENGKGRLRRRPFLIDAVTLLLTAGPLLAIAWYYRELPEQIPAHWNLRGEPDRWVARSWKAAFFAPVLAAYLQAMLRTMQRDMERDGVGASVRLCGEMVGWVRLLVAVLTAGVSLNLVVTTDRVLRAYSRWTGWVIGGSAMAMVALVMFYVLRMASLPQTGSRREGEGSKWVAGVIYYNSQDPALFVDKRFGLGQTINFAHPRARVYLGFFLGLPVILAWGLLAL
jgi:uncharacterized membrane protein